MQICCKIYKMSSFKYIIGIDEVGRGALAGPVYLAGTLLNTNLPKYTYFYSQKDFPKKYKSLEFIRDSKKLSPINRNKAVETILRHNHEQLTLSCSADLIDKYGIGTCLSYMMHIIITHLYKPGTKTVVDGKIKILNSFDTALLNKIYFENKLNKSTPITSYYFHDKTKPASNIKDSISIIREPKADDKYLSIAIASNIAKTKRDKFMVDLHKKFPNYNWDQNKGYGTVKNRNAIKQNHQNVYLRQSFLGNIINLNSDEKTQL